MRIMKHDELIGYGVSGTGGVLTFLQTIETFQIIQGILSIIALLVTIGYTIWKWYKNAKKDGKISPDEVEDLIDDIKEVTEDGDRD